MKGVKRRFSLRYVGSSPMHSVDRKSRVHMFNIYLWILYTSINNWRSKANQINKLCNMGIILFIILGIMLFFHVARYRLTPSNIDKILIANP